RRHQRRRGCGNIRRGGNRRAAERLERVVINMRGGRGGIGETGGAGGREFGQFRVMNAVRGAINVVSRRGRGVVLPMKLHVGGGGGRRRQSRWGGQNARRQQRPALERFELACVPQVSLNPRQFPAIGDAVLVYPS